MIYIILLIVVLIVISLIICINCFKESFYRSVKKEKEASLPLGKTYNKEDDYFTKLIDKYNNMPYEDVYIKSYDGIKLHGRYYHYSDNAPVDICFHGYRSNLERFFCGGVNVCFASKHNVLVVDHRACGHSEGKLITFGVKERFDCKAWVEYIVNRFPESKIILYGVSMGAATILMASSLDLPKNVVGIIADSSYTRPKDIIQKTMLDRNLPLLMYPFVNASAMLFGRFNLHCSSPIDSVQRTNIPILLIHGNKDPFVPLEMSQKIKSVAKSCRKLNVFETPEHGRCYLADEKRYAEVFEKFTKEVLN